RYGFASTERPIEAITARVRTRIPTGASSPGLSIRKPRASTGAKPIVGRWPVWIDQLAETPFVAVRNVAPGEDIEGPAMLIDEHSPTVLPRDWTAVGTIPGHLRLTRGRGG